MRTHPAFITFVFLIVCSCNVQLDKPTPVLANSTRDNIEIQSDRVENHTRPTVIPAENPNIIKAGKPIAVLRQTNQKKAGTPSKIAAANPSQKTPGLDGVGMPTVKPAGFVPMNAIIPEIVTAKEPYWKDQNPFNISTFSKAQGLKGNLVGSILEDKNGNIWLGTTYGGFSRYDGKSFYHYYQQDGPNPSVRSILEDKSGVLWFGMQGGGVVRYDGHRFLRLTTKEGLSDENVFSLLKDSSGNLWVGTLGGGLGKFDGTHFTNYTTNEGLIDNYIMCLMEDKSGNIWFGSYFGGLSKFDGKRFSHFTQEQGLSHNNVTSIHEDKSGLIWVGTKNGLNAFDGVSFSHYTTEEGLSSNDISEILEDKDGYMWFSTSGGGVNRYDGDKFVHITEVEGLSINYVSSMMEDKFGTLWFGTGGGGVSIYSKGFEQVTKKTGLGNNFVSSILEDRSGNLWFGTFSGGVSKYDGHKFTHYTKNEGLVSNHVSCMVEDTDGTMWFGTWEGISKFDGQTFTNYTSKDGLSGNMVWSLLIDQKGHLWIGLDKNGVNQFDGINFTQFSHIQGLGEKTVFSMLEDQRGYLWFGTSGSGLYNYDGEKYTHFTDGAGFDREYIWPIIEDQTGNIWVGTRGSGLKLLNLNQETNEITMSKFSVQEGLSNNRVTSLMISRKGDLWIGTGNGLNKMEQATLSLIGRSPNISLEKPLFNTYTVEEGFSAVGLNHGKTILEASDGTIWLGGDDRVMAFRPDAIPEDTTVPNIQLTGLTLFNEKVNWELFIKASSNSKETQLVDDHYTSNGVNSSKQTKNEKHNHLMLANGVKVHDIRLDGLSKWYGMPQDLSLPFDNNFITFEFVGITTKSPKKVKYRYKLEGLDQSWSALTTRSEAPYGNLSHGEYIFKVQAVNAAGIWSNELAYPFEIRPPWWLTWWAQFLYGLFVIGAVVGLRQYTVNRERMKHA
nr:hypothetical protein [Cytophagales bacterium]